MKYSEEQRADVLNMLDRGLSTMQVQRRTKIALKTIQEWRRKARGRRWKPATAQEKEQAYRMHLEGVPHREIARQMGRGSSTIDEWVRLFEEPPDSRSKPKSEQLEELKWDVRTEVPLYTTIDEYYPELKEDIQALMGKSDDWWWARRNFSIRHWMKEARRVVGRGLS